jgi:hypothetical protein
MAATYFFYARTCATEAVCQRVFSAGPPLGHFRVKRGSLHEPWAMDAARQSLSFKPPP